MNLGESIIQVSQSVRHRICKMVYKQPLGSVNSPDIPPKQMGCSDGAIVMWRYGTQMTSTSGSFLGRALDSPNSRTA